LLIRRWWRRRVRKGSARRWVVVDVEASGLDAAGDRLLAVAGVAVLIEQGRPRLPIGDSFEVVLRQEAPAAGADVDRENILLHGIGLGAQQAGIAPPDALAAFWRWVGDDPIIGYHVAFDRTLIQRYSAAHLGRRWPNAWVDLEHVVRVVVPGLPSHSLDSAMERLELHCLRRHQAAADALATAEVLLRIWDRAQAEMGGRSDIAAFSRLAARHHWLPKAG
jgi:DNA polymerase-3 subunit epsilon